MDGGGLMARSNALRIVALISRPGELRSGEVLEKAPGVAALHGGKGVADELRNGHEFMELMPSIGLAWSHRSGAIVTVWPLIGRSRAPHG
jgi:hypothetical protein